MLSVFIEAGDEPAELAASLAALVSGAVDGLVREVVVVDRGLGDGARRVADHAGCRIEAGTDGRALIGSAKGEWLLLLEAGARLAPGWIEAVTAHIADIAAGRATPAAARFRIAREDRMPFLKRVRTRPSALYQGLVLPKAQAGSALRGGGIRLADMAKGLAARQLDAEIRPRPES